MIRKANNKKLFFLFAFLAIVAVIVFFYDRQKGERTFRKDLFSVDSSMVTSIKIFGKGKTVDPLVLEKVGKNWEIIINKKKYPADSAAIANILSALGHVTTERVAASDPSGWKALELTDSLSTHVVVEQGNKVVADFRVGKISFRQSQGGMQNMRDNQGFSVKSYVRVPGDDHAYVVDGFLSVLFSDEPSQYRNRLISKFEKSLATKITFVYPGDSSFILSLNGNSWKVNDKPADSAKTAIFINSLTNLMEREFAEEDNLPITFPYHAKIEGNNMTPIELTGAIDPIQKKYYIRSGMNPAATFGSSNPRVFNLIFAPKARFQ